MATYVGFTAGGVPGAIVATLGVITPSVIVILIVARILKAFRENVYVDSAFYGLRPCSMAMIASAGVLVVKITLFDLDAGSSRQRSSTRYCSSCFRPWSESRLDSESQQ